MTKDDLAWVKKSTQQFKAENGLESSFSFSGKDKEDSENKSVRTTRSIKTLSLS